MNSRSYLSIGDVLTLLREEFPDVTISKIRFLESQGLVNPERSPSGYRKFFDHDVERLRWVLRQQREHFLPLKVIRDRLADGDLDEIEPADVATGNGKAGTPAANLTTDASSEGGRAASAARTASGRTEEQSAKADDEAMARILADASRRSALIPDATPRAALHVVESGPEPSTATTADKPARAVGKVPAPGARAPMGAGGRTDAASSSAPHPRAGTSDTEPVVPSTGDARQKATAGSNSPVAAAGSRAFNAGASSSADAKAKLASGRDGPTPPPIPPAPAPKAPMVTGASFTAEELCKASGLTEIELAGLQGFGLIEARDLAGILTFDEDALTVANLAVSFRAFGIEPRHLRLYRNAVDRELGLIEQVIIPLLRQRNPESRQRAVEGAETLGTLGQTMRATILRSALRRHIGG